MCTEAFQINTENHLVKIQSGVMRLEEEVFGDKEKGTPGLKTEMSEVHDFMVQWKTAFKIIIWLLGFVGIGNIVLIALRVGVLP